MSKYKVGKYCENHDSHMCEDENGEKMLIDLVVNGDLTSNYDSYRQWMCDLIGKTVEVDGITPFISIAHGVKLIEEVNNE